MTLHPPLPRAHALQAAGAPLAVALPPTTPTGTLPAPVDLGTLALSRLAFGPRPGDLAHFTARPGATPADKLRSYLDEQLSPRTIDDADCDGRLAREKLPTLTMSLAQCWHYLYAGVKGDDPKRYQKQIQALMDVKRATFIRAVSSRRQLYEVIVAFWHNHFNPNPERDDNLQPVFMQYDRDVIRAHALGNFRALLGAVAASPEMLYYLDNASSARSGPNENYARELFELHTMGAENYLGVAHQKSVPGFASGAPIGYVDDDVYETTRAFTGWRVDDNSGDPGMHNTGSFLYFPDWHDRFQKTVLGQFLPPDQAPTKDGHDVLDLLAAHPGTGRYIARKLCRRLIADVPPESIVTRAAALFTAQHQAADQIAQVVRLIALSDEFAAAWGQKIKTPFEVMVSSLRALDVTFHPTDDFLNYYDYRMGQPLFGHLTPDGYPDRAVAWTGTATMLARWGLAGDLVSNSIPGAHVSLLRQTPDHLSPAGLADFWMRRILGRPLEAEPARRTIVDALAQGDDEYAPMAHKTRADRLPDAVALILIAPDFHWR